MTEKSTIFVNDVLHGEPLLSDGEHALVGIRTLEVIYEVAEQDKWFR